MIVLKKKTYQMFTFSIQLTKLTNFSNQREFNQNDIIYKDGRSNMKTILITYLINKFFYFISTLFYIIPIFIIDCYHCFN